jgi:hypothetical protein
MTGRPTDYTPELVAAAWEYARGGWSDAGDPVPTVAGLACELGISRDTCYEWAKHESKEFSDILGLVAQSQERHLVKGGLMGEFSAPISKMMLTKHGYSDKVENDHTSSDGTMTPKSAVELTDEQLARIASGNDKPI